MRSTWTTASRCVTRGRACCACAWRQRHQPLAPRTPARAPLTVLRVPCWAPLCVLLRGDENDEPADGRLRAPRRRRACAHRGHALGHQRVRPRPSGYHTHGPGRHRAVSTKATADAPEAESTETETDQPATDPSEADLSKCKLDRPARDRPAQDRRAQDRPTPASARHPTPASERRATPARGAVLSGYCGRRCAVWVSPRCVVTGTRRGAARVRSTAVVRSARLDDAGASRPGCSH